jgi:hypothetical protein
MKVSYSESVAYRHTFSLAVMAGKKMKRRGGHVRRQKRVRYRITDGVQRGPAKVQRILRSRPTYRKTDSLRISLSGILGMKAGRPGRFGDSKEVIEHA